MHGNEVIKIEVQTLHIKMVINAALDGYNHTHVEFTTVEHPYSLMHDGRSWSSDYTEFLGSPMAHHMTVREREREWSQWSACEYQTTSQWGKKTCSISLTRKCRTLWERAWASWYGNIMSLMSDVTFSKFWCSVQVDTMDPSLFAPRWWIYWMQQRTTPFLCTVLWLHCQNCSYNALRTLSNPFMFKITVCDEISNKHGRITTILV